MDDEMVLASTAIEKTSEYLRVPSVVGHETPFLDYLFKEYRELGFDCFRDDNIVAVCGNDPASAHITAHIDRHGILSMGNGEYRYAAHAIKNYKYNEEGAAKKLAHLQNICSQFQTEKVFAYGRWSGQSIAMGHVNLCHFCTDRANLIFSIEDMTHMPEGIPVAYAHEPIEKDGYVSGQLDNAISVGIIHALFRSGFQGTAIFTAEEEIGKSWKHLTAFMNAKGIETERLLVLDTSPYDSSDCADAGCVILRNRDSFGSFNPELVGELRSICETLGVPYDMKDETLVAQGKKDNQLGRTELGRLIHESSRRWIGATLQVPTFNYHTNNETTTRVAISNCLIILAAYLGMG